MVRWRRGKQGFIAPEEQWFRGPLTHEIRKHFVDSTAAECGLVNQERLLHAYDRCLTGCKLWYKDIFRFFILERWLLQFYIGEGQRKIAHVSA